jgi:peptidoglycan hydrolase-like protein with peptidoglycan-binding domain
MYDTLQYIAGSSSRQQIRAGVILISGSQDNQLSYDGAVNGQFTGTLLQVWSNGSFQGSYRQFHQEILNRMPPDQSPNFFTTGAVSAAFEQQRPFTIAPPAGIGTSSGGLGTSTPASGTTRPTLGLGDQGPDVRYLQERLVAQGHPVGVDGFFGRQTEAAVRAFQRGRGLTADGIVGPRTWQALEGSGSTAAPTPYPSPTSPSTPSTPPSTRPTLRRGDRNEHVAYLQKLLIQQGYALTADGIFGSGTESAVRSFQRSNGLTADGVVGPATWQALESYRDVPMQEDPRAGCETRAYA